MSDWGVYVSKREERWMNPNKNHNWREVYGSVNVSVNSKPTHSPGHLTGISPLYVFKSWQMSHRGAAGAYKIPVVGPWEKANPIKQKYHPLLLWNCQAITHFGKFFFLLNWPSSVAFLSPIPYSLFASFLTCVEDQNEFLWVVMGHKPEGTPIWNRRVYSSSRLGV